MIGGVAGSHIVVAKVDGVLASSISTCQNMLGIASRWVRIEGVVKEIAQAVHQANGSQAASVVPNEHLRWPRRQEQIGYRNMGAERPQNLQDTFLNFVRKNKVPVTIFLVNGVKLQGVVTWFDNFCVLLRRDGHSQLVYKHAISTIMPGQPIQLFESGDEAGHAGP
jgi:host factor-I protein